MEADDERMTYWRTAIARDIPLGMIEQAEVNRIPEDAEELLIVSGMILAARGGQIPDEDSAMRAAISVRRNLVSEGLRRRFAPNRPRLFCLRDLPMSGLDTVVEISDREFMLGLAYLIRQKTGRELTAEEAATEVDSRMTGGRN